MLLVEPAWNMRRLFYPIKRVETSKAVIILKAGRGEAIFFRCKVVFGLMDVESNDEVVFIKKKVKQTWGARLFVETRKKDKTEVKLKLKAINFWVRMGCG